MPQLTACCMAATSQPFRLDGRRPNQSQGVPLNIGSWPDRGGELGNAVETARKMTNATFQLSEDQAVKSAKPFSLNPQDRIHRLANGWVARPIAAVSDSGARRSALR